MYNHVIYFIIVLLLYNITYPGGRPEESWLFSLACFLLSWGLFAAYCHFSFGRLMARATQGEDDERSLAGLYQGLVLRLSILAILLFAFDVWLLHLKYWLQTIPGIGRMTAIHGLFAVTVFILYLTTIWFFGHLMYGIAFRTQLSRSSFVLSNVKLQVPILFPWIFLSLLQDGLFVIPWPFLHQVLEEPAGQMMFFALFLGILMVFMPLLIRSWWGCETLRASEKVEALKGFLAEKDFEVRAMLKWPIFEGRMLTAGIMGLVPRYRYILITESLLNVLSIQELKAVLAHEMGHVKHRHFLFYLLFFLGFMVLSFGFFDMFLHFLATHPFFIRLLQMGDSRGASLFYLFLSLPVLLVMLVYFRYVMGFFMRHFERQADLFSALSMGTPEPIISSLEKIALLGGKIRDLPSWHHFSIKERVGFLWRTSSEPGLARRHNRFVLSAFASYLILMAALGYLLNFSPLKETLWLHWAEHSLQRQIETQPHNLQLYQNLAMVYHKVGNEREAAKTYDRLIGLDPENALALNNLAWLLATSEDEGLRDQQRALELAKGAVSLERSAMYLDTLAEAYFVNGRFAEAVETIKEAIAVAAGPKTYYEGQLRRFQGKNDSE